MKKINEKLSMIGFYTFIILIIFCCTINTNKNDEFITAQKTETETIYVLS